jgi:hypothetical protein
MRYCVHCGLQRPNHFKSDNCPKCGAYLKYLEGAAKRTTVNLYKAGIYTSYAVAEVYSYANNAVHTANISIGLAKPYQEVVLRDLPAGIVYYTTYTLETLSHIPIDHLISPMRTYGLLRFETAYLDQREARAVLKQKLKELDTWIDEAIDSGWLAILNLGGLL